METIVKDQLEKAIRHLLQINDDITNAHRQGVNASDLQQTRLMVASMVYALCVVQSEAVNT
jgi:hypothetical protein